MRPAILQIHSLAFIHSELLQGRRQSKLGCSRGWHRFFSLIYSKGLVAAWQSGLQTHSPLCCATSFTSRSISTLLKKGAVHLLGPTLPTLLPCKCNCSIWENNIKSSAQRTTCPGRAATRARAVRRHVGAEPAVLPGTHSALGVSLGHDMLWCRHFRLIASGLAWLVL